MPVSVITSTSDADNHMSARANPREPRRPFVSVTCDVLTFRSRMRGWFAKFTLLVMAWTCVAPAYAWASTTAVPACCRRDGMHHCMALEQMASPASSRQPAFDRHCQGCPFSAQITPPAFADILQLRGLLATRLRVAAIALFDNAQVSDFDSAFLRSPRAPPLS